jgi:hypothetical protein
MGEHRSKEKAKSTSHSKSDFDALELRSQIDELQELVRAMAGMPEEIRTLKKTIKKLEKGNSGDPTPSRDSVHTADFEKLKDGCIKLQSNMKKQNNILTRKLEEQEARVLAQEREIVALKKELGLLKLEKKVEKKPVMASRRGDMVLYSQKSPKPPPEEEDDSSDSSADFTPATTTTTNSPRKPKPTVDDSDSDSDDALEARARRELARLRKKRAEEDSDFDDSDRESPPSPSKSSVEPVATHRRGRERKFEARNVPKSSIVTKNDGDDSEGEGDIEIEIDEPVPPPPGSFARRSSIASVESVESMDTTPRKKTISLLPHKSADLYDEQRKDSALRKFMLKNGKNSDLKVRKVHGKSLVFFEDRVYIPESLRRKTLDYYWDKCKKQKLNPLIQCEKNCFWPDMKEQYKKFDLERSGKYVEVQVSYVKFEGTKKKEDEFNYECVGLND